MDSDKALNKELVEENQTMRKTLAEYQSEIIRLRAKLMEVEINYNRIGIQGASLLKYLAEEARRSSSVIQTARSFNSTSPVRSSSTDVARNINDGNTRVMVEEQESDANLETEEESSPC
ncbi:uncharacterized protein [Musca autumnalis]|uniref:uncharacterized protein n=1 Tax=Musca autumnalis TaxID=221902 RepID=UPI003CF955BB